MKLKPSRPLLAAVAAALALAVLAALLRSAWPQPAAWLTVAAAAGLGLVLLAALFDARRRSYDGALPLQRQLPSQFVQGVAHRITFHFTPPVHPYWRQPRQLLLADLHPPGWQTDTPLLTMTVLPGRSSQISYQVTPLQRGGARYGGIEYWLPSAWGLWQHRYLLPADEEVRVLPDFSRILGAELISMQRWLNWIGVKKTSRLGQGQDFHQLRDYREGDDIRHIDWKATAKLHKPIVRSFHQEQDQQLIFLLDCGRNMRLYMDGLSHFDHSLQAMLLLSFTALKHGDAVGMLGFAHPQARFVPPHKGMEQLGRLVQGVYDIEPSLQAGDLESAVSLLLHRQQRRALVVVLTHINHEESEGLTRQLLRLKKHHLVLLASLRPQAPEQLLQAPIRQQNDAAAYLGAWQYREQTEQALQHIRAHQLFCLNTLPNQLSSSLINRYLELKRRQAW